MAKILIVDDEQSICWGLEQLGKSLGHKVVTASNAETAIELAAENVPNLIVLDVRLPGMDGLTAMEKLKDRCPKARIIVITAYGELRTAVAAIKKGAFEYIVKPFELEVVQQAMERALSDEPSPELGPARTLEGFVGRSPAMQEVFKRIALTATSDTCVLIKGESGTGKELAARAIHRFSSRSDRPFVAVNVAALSPTLAESELFGHIAGSFTGADRDKHGLIEQADGGSLFLDEVADIPLPVQIKLLRCLELGEVTPVGSTQAIKSDFRVICATHQDLNKFIESGKFRHDLFYRLSAFQIELPPLRDRGNDLIELASYFVEQAVQRSNLPCPTLSDEAVAEIKSRHWPGNVRELRNAIEHAVIVARGGRIVPDHLPKSVVQAPLPDTGAGIDQRLFQLVQEWTRKQLNDETSSDLYDELLKCVEPPIFETLLSHHKGQYQATARRLGLHRTTLKKKMTQHGMNPD